MINSGIVVVDGPVSDGNSGLDYDANCTINGGYIFIAGSSGMAEGFSSDSTQCGALLAVTNGSAENTVSLADSKGNVILSYTPSKKYSALNISSPDMKTGETYTLYTGITELNSRISKGGTISDGSSFLEYTQTDVTYSDIKGGFGPGGNGRPNGRPSMPDGEMPGMPDSTRPERPGKTSGIS